MSDRRALRYLHIRFILEKWINSKNIYENYQYDIFADGACNIYLYIPFHTNFYHYITLHFSANEVLSIVALDEKLMLVSFDKTTHLRSRQ